MGFEGSAVGVDYRLRVQVATRTVREFVESIDNYELTTLKTVRVWSDYTISRDPGLQEQVPKWLAERLRFGIVRPQGDIAYLDIHTVDVQALEEGTELFLHLAHKVAPGTRAFIAAYLGSGDGSDQLRELPRAMLQGEPG
ncbi:MAG TPA: hypothetical protein DIU15_07705 [Deltaproteobacteria bacterium]|nr:hypothetical protein [Deltaproteobacteria bacterium]